MVNLWCIKNMFGNWKPSISFSCGYNVEALQGWLETLEIGICMARNWRSLNVAGGIRKILIWIFVARAARELYLNQPTDESYNAKIWVPTFPEYYPGIGLRKNQKEALHLVVIPSFPVSILRWASMEVTSGILIPGFQHLGWFGYHKDWKQDEGFQSHGWSPSHHSYATVVFSY